MSVHYLAELPAMHQSYLKVLKQAYRLKKNHHKHKCLPQQQYIVENIHIDHANLHQYQQFCHWQNQYQQIIPATYLAMLSQRLQIVMMALDDFPFAVLGLVHLSNRIKQYRIVSDHEQLTMCCQFGEQIAHQKGTAFSFIVQVYVGHELVVEIEMQYLALDKSVAKSKKSSSSQHQSQLSVAWQSMTQWSLAANSGWKYAKISGDFNPVHLHHLTARWFGFKHPIAHGLWLKACVLAKLAADIPHYDMAVNFKMPAFLPSTVELLLDKQQDHMTFLVQNVHQQKPHLQGTIHLL